MLQHSHCFSAMLNTVFRISLLKRLYFAARSKELLIDMDLNLGAGLMHDLANRKPHV